MIEPWERPTATGDSRVTDFARDVRCAIMGGNVRYSPHFYNTLEDIERAADAIANLA